LLIQETKPFPAQIAAHEAVHAVAAVQKKGAIGAVIAKEEIAAVLAIHALHALVEEGGFLHLRTVDAIIALASVVCVEHVLGLMCTGAEVAVLAFAHVGIEFTILRKLDSQGGKGHVEEQSVKLLKERDREVVGTTEIERIESIAVPVVLLAYLVGGVGGKDGDDVLSRDIARTTVKMTLIPKTHSPALAAVRAERRGWDGECLLPNHR